MSNASTATPIVPEKPEPASKPAVTAPIPETAGNTIITMIREASAKYGIDDDLAVAIARCESSLRQYDQNGNVVRGKVNPKDIGVFQINEDYHLSRSQKLGLDIYTTHGNIEYALSLIKKSGNKPWSSSKACWVDHVAMN